MTKEKETITLNLEDFKIISNGLDTINELDHPELFHEDIQGLIQDELYGIAGFKLMDLQDKIDAHDVIKRINKERNMKKDEKKTNRGSNS